jgi:hypothetical protein
MRKRTYFSLFHTDFETNTTKEIEFTLDHISKVGVDINLTVCSTDTVRGRNKTDHAYRNQNVISISGSFSERTVDEINSRFFRYGKNKLKNIQDLFLCFLKDGRLFYVYTRFKTYKNYVLKGASFSYSESVSGMKVDLSFVEVMFRNNPDLYVDTLQEDFSPKIIYSPPLTDASLERTIVEYVSEEEFIPVTKTVVTNKVPTVKEASIPLEITKGDTSLAITYNKVVTGAYERGPRKSTNLALESVM